jgi:SAM-dependent methyltransferase
MEELFYNIFKGLPRLGPGDNASTRKAFFTLPVFSENAQILDIGCGTGMQTLELARLSHCPVLALDNHEPYLRDLSKRARDEQLDKKITTIKGDMHNLPFSEAEFDLIWSEGSIYIIGFENGLKEWRKYLNPGGYLVVTELIWTSENPPYQLIQFWKEEYPAMRSDEACKKLIDQSGYQLVRDFLLPHHAWWDEYYVPLGRRLSQLKKEYSSNDRMIELIRATELEIDTYEKFNSFYGYAFYIMKKT